MRSYRTLLGGMILSALDVTSVQGSPPQGTLGELLAASPAHSTTLPQSALGSHHGVAEDLSLSRSLGSRTGPQAGDAGDEMAQHYRRLGLSRHRLSTHHTLESLLAEADLHEEIARGAERRASWARLASARASRAPSRSPPSSSLSSSTSWSSTDVAAPDSPGSAVETSPARQERVRNLWASGRRSVARMGAAAWTSPQSCRFPIRSGRRRTPSPQRVVREGRCVDVL